MATPDLSRFLPDAPAEGLASGNASERPAGPDLSRFLPEQPSEGVAQQVDLSRFVQGPQDLGDEFVSGVSSGTDQLQMTLFGLLNMVSRELNIPEAQAFSERGIARNQEEAAAIAPSVQSFSDIGSMDDFFSWAAGALGNAVPSLGSAIAGGGVGGVVGRKAVEASIRDGLKRQITGQLTAKGIARESAEETAERAVRSRAGLDMIRNGMSRPGVKNQVLLNRGFTRGATLGSVGVSAPPQSGEAALSLAEAGIEAPGTALLAGLAGGALEALPALRLIDNLFPGVDRAVSRSFVQDFAKVTGTQSILEGGTEAAQEVIQLASLAYHDPTFDFMDPTNARQVLDAFAAGALVGSVTGAGSSVGLLGADRPGQDVPPPALDGVDIQPTRRTEFPPDFEPADNTLFEEIRSRVDSTVGELITPAFNTIRDTFQDTINQVSQAAPAVNQRLRDFTGPIVQAQREFVEGHRPILDDTRRFAREQIQWIYENAAEIPAGVQRNQWIQARVAEVREQVQEVADQIRQRASRVAETTATRVGTLGIANDPRSPFDQLQDAQIGDPTQIETDFVFGQRGTRGENVIGFKNRSGSQSSARGLLESLRQRFPSANDSTFVIRQQEDGSWVVALQDAGQAETLREDEVLADALDAARRATRNNPERAKEAARLRNEDGTETLIDVRTLVFQGRQLGEGDVQSAEQAFATMAGGLLDRGLITRDQLTTLGNKFDELFPSGERSRSLRELRSRTDPRLEAQRTLEALTPEQRRTINERIDDRLAEEQISDPRERATRRGELLEAALENIDEQVRGGRTLPNEDVGIQGQDGVENLDFNRNDEVQGPRQTRGSTARPRRTGATRQQTRQPKKGVEALSEPRSEVKVYMPGAPKVLRDALGEFLTQSSKLLRKGAKVRLVNTKGVEQMIEQDHPNAVDMLPPYLTGDFSIQIDPKTRTYWIFVPDDRLNDAGEVINAVTHEFGHALHFDTWQGLTMKEQDELWAAFVDQVEGGDRQSGGLLRSRGSPEQRAEVNMFEFREWMADQFVDWMQSRRQPRNAMERFMEKVAKKVDAMWQWINTNSGRFNQLNQTYAEWLDSIALRVAKGDPTYDQYTFPFESKRGRPTEFLFDANASINLGIMQPKGLDQQQWQELATRLETEYPATVRNVRKMTDWMHQAYYVALAPSTSAMRDLSKRGIKAADQLVTRFNRQEHGKPKMTRNYHQRIKLMKGQFLNRYDKITQGMTENEKKALVERMRKMDGKTDVQPRGLKERQLRQLFDDLRKYLVDSGLPVGKIENYFPRSFSRDKLRQNEDKIVNWLMKTNKMTRSKAEGFYNSLLDGEADAAAALAEVQADEMSMQSPSFRNMRSRTTQAAFWNQFYDDNLDGIVGNYINAATKRGEYNRFLGSKAPAGVPGGDRLPRKVWNPQQKLDDILAQAEKEGASKKDLTRMKDYVDANLGQFGRDSAFASERARTAMATVLAYQNMRTLLFTVFASLPDLAGPAIRTGSMREAWIGYTENLKSALTSNNELDEMAKAWGLLTSAANQHVLTEYVDNHYMPPTIRKWNDAFFKWTGLNFYTDFTRKAALGIGRNYIKARAAEASNPMIPDKQRLRARRALKELGLNEKLVNEWVAGGERVWGGVGYDNDSTADQRVAEALVQFVDESVLSPNPSQRPILASHPAYMLIFHLKGFMYAMYDTILKRLKFNFDDARNPAQVMAAVAPAIAMLALTALGLELRELITGTRRTDRMNGWDYTWEVTERSGLLGLGQLGFDFEGADARGQAELAAVGGPTLSQIGDLLSKPASQTIPKGIPVVSQLPWARDALRNATPL